jgi:predicted xylose isomerase-like sugar epimerase
VTQGLRDLKVPKVTQGLPVLKALKGLKEFKDHRVTQGLLEPMGRPC